MANDKAAKTAEALALNAEADEEMAEEGVAASVPIDEENEDADEASGLTDQLESEAVAPAPKPGRSGGLQTTDPSFTGGAMEVDSKSNRR